MGSLSLRWEAPDGQLVRILTLRFALTASSRIRCSICHEARSPFCGTPGAARLEYALPALSGLLGVAAGMLVLYHALPFLQILK